MPSPELTFSDFAQACEDGDEVAFDRALIHVDCLDPASNKNEALGRACRHGRLNIVNRLLSLHDDRIWAADNHNFALRIATENGHAAIVERLLRERHVDPSQHNSEPLRVASVYGHVGVVDCLLRDGRADPADADNSALREACLFGHVAVVDRLLQDARVDPTARDGAALQIACEFGRLPVVERLLQDARVDPAANANEALKDAAMNCHLAVVERLLADPRVYSAVAAKSHALSLAAARVDAASFAIIQLLWQDERVDVAAENNDALRSASQNDSPAGVEFLLTHPRAARHVNPAACNNYALQHASRLGYSETVNRLLRDERVDPDVDCVQAPPPIDYNNMQQFRHECALRLQQQQQRQCWRLRRRRRQQRVVDDDNDDSTDTDTATAALWNAFRRLVTKTLPRRANLHGDAIKTMLAQCVGGDDMRRRIWWS